MNFAYLAQEIYQGFDDTNRHVVSELVFSSIDKIRANNYIIDDTVRTILSWKNSVTVQNKDLSLGGHYTLQITKVRII